MHETGVRNANLTGPEILIESGFLPFFWSLSRSFPPVSKSGFQFQRANTGTHQLWADFTFAEGQGRRMEIHYNLAPPDLHYYKRLCLGGGAPRFWRPAPPDACPLWPPTNPLSSRVVKQKVIRRALSPIVSPVSRFARNSTRYSVHRHSPWTQILFTNYNQVSTSAFLRSDCWARTAMKPTASSNRLLQTQYTQHFVLPPVRLKLPLT